MLTEEAPTTPEETAPAAPSWVAWTRRAGFGFVLVVALALVFILGYAVINKEEKAAVGAERVTRDAPDFTINLFSGGTFTLSAYRGKPVLVNFWASWCGPCREEAPVLEQAWKTYRDKGVVFIGVDVMDGRADALGFIDEFGITYPNGPDESNVYGDYGGTGVPESYFIDRDGKVVIKFAGAMNAQQITAFLEEILK